MNGFITPPSFSRCLKLPKRGYALYGPPDTDRFIAVLHSEFLYLINAHALLNPPADTPATDNAWLLGVLVSDNNSWTTSRHLLGNVPVYPKLANKRPVQRPSTSTRRRQRGSIDFKGQEVNFNSLTKVSTNKRKLRKTTTNVHDYHQDNQNSCQNGTPKSKRRSTLLKKTSRLVESEVLPEHDETPKPLSSSRVVSTGDCSEDEIYNSDEDSTVSVGMLSELDGLSIQDFTPRTPINNLLANSSVASTYYYMSIGPSYFDKNSGDRLWPIAICKRGGDISILELFKPYGFKSLKPKRLKSQINLTANLISLIYNSNDHYYYYGYQLLDQHKQNLHSQINYVHQPLRNILNISWNLPLPLVSFPQQFHLHSTDSDSSTIPIDLISSHADTICVWKIKFYRSDQSTSQPVSADQIDDEWAEPSCMLTNVIKLPVHPHQNFQTITALKYYSIDDESKIIFAGTSEGDLFYIKINMTPLKEQELVPSSSLSSSSSSSSALRRTDLVWKKLKLAQDGISITYIEMDFWNSNTFLLTVLTSDTMLAIIKVSKEAESKDELVQITPSSPYDICARYIIGTGRLTPWDGSSNTQTEITGQTATTGQTANCGWGLYVVDSDGQLTALTTNNGEVCRMCDNVNTKPKVKASSSEFHRLASTATVSTPNNRPPSSSQCYGLISLGRSYLISSNSIGIYSDLTLSLDIVNPAVQVLRALKEQLTYQPYNEQISITDGPLFNFKTSFKRAMAQHSISNNQTNSNNFLNGHDHDVRANGPPKDIFQIIDEAWDDPNHKLPSNWKLTKLIIHEWQTVSSIEHYSQLSRKTAVLLASLLSCLSNICDPEEPQFKQLILIPIIQNVLNLFQLATNHDYFALRRLSSILFVLRGLFTPNITATHTIEYDDTKPSGVADIVAAAGTLWSSNNHSYAESSNTKQLIFMFSLIGSLIKPHYNPKWKQWAENTFSKSIIAQDHTITNHHDQPNQHSATKNGSIIISLIQQISPTENLAYCAFCNLPVPEHGDLLFGPIDHSNSTITDSITCKKPIQCPLCLSFL